MECEVVEECHCSSGSLGSEMLRCFIVCLVLVIYPILCTFLVSSVALVSK